MERVRREFTGCWLGAVCLFCLLFSFCSPTTRNDPVLDKPLDELSDEDISRMVAVVTTNYGDFKIELHPEWAPQTTRNFIKLIKAGFYEGLTFHEVRPTFWIRGGDPKGDGTGGPGYYVPLETPSGPHEKGAVGLYHPVIAPDEGGSQFYILLRMYPKWNGHYTVFGRVSEGMVTVDIIGDLPITPKDGKPRGYMPLSPVIIKEIHLEVKR